MPYYTLWRKILKNNTSDDNKAYTPSDAWKVLAILSTISTMVLYAETMLMPAIPHLISDFHITYSTSSWILSAYLISGAISVPIAGKISDIYGRKKVLLIIMAIYTVGVIGGAFSTDISSLIISRIIQGVGMSVFPIVFAIVHDQFPKDKLAVAQGTLASMFAFGGVLGLLAGGYIIQYFGWRFTFYSVIPISIFLIIIIRRYIKVKEPSLSLHQGGAVKDKTGIQRIESKDQGIISKLDLKGIILLAITIISFLSAVTLLRSENTNSTQNSPISQEFVFLIIASFVSLIAFLMVERKASTPLIDLELISKNPTWITNIIIIIWGICTFAIFQTLPVLIQSPTPFGMGRNAIDVAIIQLPFSISSLVFGPTSGWIISKIGASKVTRIGAIVLATGLFGTFISHNEPVKLAINLVIVGTGLSLLNVGQLNIITSSVPMKSIGVSLGINTLLRYIGSAIGPAIAGMLMQTNLKTIQNTDTGIKTFPSSEAYNFIFLFIFALSALTIFLSLLIRKSPKDVAKDQKEQ
jgi:MFS family permease